MLNTQLGNGEKYISLLSNVCRNYLCFTFDLNSYFCALSIHDVQSKEAKKEFTKNLPYIISSDVQCQSITIQPQYLLQVINWINWHCMQGVVFNQSNLFTRLAIVREGLLVLEQLAVMLLSMNWIWGVIPMETRGGWDTVNCCGRGREECHTTYICHSA